MLATAGLAFVIGAFTFTLGELVGGGSVGNNDRRTTLIGGSGKKKSTDNLNIFYTPPRPTIIHSPATQGPVAGIVDLDYGTARFVVRYD